MADRVSTPKVSPIESPNGDPAVSTDFLQVSASEDDAIENSIMGTDSQTKNESISPSPQHALGHFDPPPQGTNRFFLDMCAGASRPLSSAILALNGDVCSFDILLHSSDDLLSDTAYERLLRLASSGLIAYGCGSPACRDYSRLKLRPNGPKALRTPGHLNGVPGLTADEMQRVRDSACMLSRTIMILTLVFLVGGHVHLEQPQNAMSWLEPVAQSFIRHIAFHCVVIAACCYEANWDKAWLFAASWDKFRSLAGTCPHPRGSHESVIGTRDWDGSFRSRKTAEYPKRLAISIANLVIPLLFRILLIYQLTMHSNTCLSNHFRIFHLAVKTEAVFILHRIGVCRIEPQMMFFNLCAIRCLISFFPNICTKSFWLTLPTKSVILPLWTTSWTRHVKS